MTQDQDIPNSVKRAVEEVLRDRLARPVSWLWTFARIATSAAILLVDVNCNLVDRPISSKITFGLPTEVRKALISLGESRFPQIRHHFNEQQKIAR
ncbi:hypothetical protein [Rhizobium sp. 007]|uniref:hypothetical protein n=1 Tax=Rhizobium sp. 007 TaxID=2785056 RepID=UPI001FEFC3C2|nr:hypothetical protein [Rhizobium sp. 007]